MGQEKERRFRVTGDAYQGALVVKEIQQGYLGKVEGLEVRVRVIDLVGDLYGNLTLKGDKVEGVGLEIDPSIEADEALDLLKRCKDRVIVKTRFCFPYKGHIFEVDEFHGRHEGLVLAEVELKEIGEHVELPDWIGEEVTGDKSLSNYVLACKGEMKKIVRQVTVTGADDSTSVPEMIRIQEEYPFVEWGILLSKHSEGSSRFPTSSWIKQLKLFQDKLNLSGHLCGRWVRDICDGKNTLYEDRPQFTGLFSRYQLNFHACQHRIKNNVGFIGAVLSLYAKQVIFQFDDVNNDLMKVARKLNVDAVPLFDTSGGAGVLPKEWPLAMNVYSGYAGGLSPENLQGQMGAIAEKCGDGPIWIDAETWLRSHQDTVFDLNKVRAFLEAAKPWVI